MAISDGLKCLLHFTGNTTDSSGEGNNVTNSGATLTTDKNSVSNQAYNFDGSNDYMILPSTEFGYNTGSISLWFYKTGAGSSTAPYIISRDGGSPRSWFMFILESNNLIYFGLRNSSDTAIGTVVSTSTISENVWNHTCVTWDGSNIKLYLNKVFEHTVSQTGIVRADNITGYIGARTADNLFQGKIDEVVIKNTVFTDGGISIGQTVGGEVAELFDNYDTAFDTSTIKKTGLEFGGGL